MMVAEQTSRQESGAVVAVAACRDTVAVATARSISLLRLEGAADVRELRRCASPGGSVVAVAVERRGDFLAVACNSRGDDRLLAVYDFSRRRLPNCERGPRRSEAVEDALAPRRGRSMNGRRAGASPTTMIDPWRTGGALRRQWVELPFPDDVTLVPET